MSGPRVAPKWRPPLSWIVFSVLLSVLAMPAAVVIWFRALDSTSSRIGPVELSALGVALVLTLIIAYVFTRTVTGPIEALIARTHEIERGGRAAIRPIERHGTREIAMLSQSFLDLARKFVERSDYVESFAVHVAHELKSPLAAIKGAAELLREAEADEGMSSQDRLRFLDHIVADAARLAALLDRLRDLARAESPLVGEPVALASAGEDLARAFPALEIALAGETDTTIALPREAAAIVFGHLADNALRHGATRLALSIRAEGSMVTIEIGDDGEGISHANGEHVFEPFFTTRRENGGTGMGLSIVRTVLASHGGSIDLLPSATGARFLVRVPQT